MAAPGRVTNRDVVALNVTISRLTDPTRAAETSAAATHLHAWQLACATGRYDHKATLVAHPQAPPVLLPVYAAQTHPMLVAAFAGRPTHDAGAAAALAAGTTDPQVAAAAVHASGWHSAVVDAALAGPPGAALAAALLPQLCATALTTDQACSLFTVYATDEYTVRTHLPTSRGAAWGQPCSPWPRC